MAAMALLDNDGVYGAARFHLAAQKIGIKAHIGAEITVRHQTSDIRNQKAEGRKQKADRNDIQTFVLSILVRDRTGYQNLCRLITLMKLRVPKHAKPGECAGWDEGDRPGERSLDLGVVAFAAPSYSMASSPTTSCHLP